MRVRIFFLISILIACMCGCKEDNTNPISSTNSVEETDKIVLTATPKPTEIPSPTRPLTRKEQYELEEKQREEERIALLASPTPGPEPYALLGTERIVEVGDVVTIGEYSHLNIYEQPYEAFPVKWIVLEKKDEKILLLSLQSINVYSYVRNSRYIESKKDGFTWENSDIRGFLNDWLLGVMFQQNEWSCICPTVIHTPNNPVYGTSGGEDTTDYLFLLSIEEVQRYFLSDVDRKTQVVPDVYFWEWDLDLQPYEHDLNTTDCYDWWLRSPGESPEKAACVGRFGDIMLEGQWVNDETVSVRPAMWIDLNKVKEVGLEMTEGE